jgi:hypothetical protein
MAAVKNRVVTSWYERSRKSIGRGWVLQVMVMLVLFAIVVRVSSAQVNVTTWHNDIGRTGQNLNETSLNTSNVTTSLFGKLFAQPVDGQIYAQPLYLSGITINGAAHNVVFVATEHDSVYAFDADSNGGSNSAPLWKASMLTAAHGAATGATTVPSSDIGSDITPEAGITGTPVIDPASGTLYVVSKTLENSIAVQRLHALDVTTGAEKLGGPVLITATINGTGNGSVNGKLTFDQLWENQRPGLLLLNGIVYVGFAAHGDNGPWHGWVLAYNAANLAQTGAFCTSPNGTGAGLWMSGAGLAADQLDPVNKPFGRMFVATGNGDYNATSPYTNSMDYGDSHLNLDLTNGIPNITDEFTTNQQATLNSEDGDVGSGGLMVVPTQTTGSYAHLEVQAGKGGTLYLLNRDNLGGYNTTTDQAVQEQAYSVGNVGVWSTPAYWNGNVYVWGRFDYLKAFPLTSGKLSTTPSKSTEEYGYPGATPSISANGTSQGIVWTIDSENYANSTAAILQAHDASNVATTLYSSATNAARDGAGVAVKFVVPTIANGKVYVGTAAEIDVYGLLNGSQQTKAPAFSPGTESFSGTINVTISDGTPGATIYYTIDGTAPTTASNVYSGPIAVTSTETINAIASVSGMLQSAQSAATYTAITQTAAPVFSLPSGTYASAQTVTLSDSSPTPTIYYTLDGSTPTTASPVYTSPINVTASEKISAMALSPGLTSSPVSSQTYTIQIGQTGIAFGEGFAASTGLIYLNGSAQLNDARLQLTDGLSGEAGSAWYMSPVNIQTFTTDFTFQLSNPAANGITFAIQNASQNYYALGGNAYELGYAPLTSSAAIKFDLYNSAGEGPDSTGLYLNGAIPTVPALNLSGTGIDLHSDDTIAVHLVYNGTTLTMTMTDLVTAAVWSTSWTVNLPAAIGSNTAYVGFTGSTGGLTASQKILTWSYINGAGVSPVTAPAFSPAAGTYTAAQSVTISDTTSGAKIYYTTNGSAPTSSSTLYSGPITVSSSETIQAIAVSGASASSAVSAAYTIAPFAVTPTFSPAPGSYTAAQSVTISDATSGAKIYYTTNGTTPTTSSTLYSATVSVGVTQTIKAVAVAAGYTNSPVASGAFTITLPAANPTFSVAAGTYTTAQTVAVSDSTPGAKIYYTINGTTPTTASSLYSAPIAVGTSETIQAIAVATGYSQSALTSAAYVIHLTTATPAFSLAAGSYATTQTVTLTDATTGAKIYYTVDGTTPTSSSTLYSAAISVSVTETIKAVAIATGYTNSSVATAAYTIAPLAATPAFSVAAGTYATAQTVSLSDTTAAAKIYYTTNGATPTTASTLYSSAITVSGTESIKAIAVAVGYTNSVVATASYTINATPPVINFGSAFTATNLNLYGSSIVNGELELTNGGTGEANIAWYTTPVNVQKFTTDFSFTVTSATADGFTFVLQNSPSGVWALGGNGFELGYGGIANSVAVKFDLYSNSGEGTDSTGIYINGATPTIPSVDMTSSGVNLHSGHIMHAHLTYDGTTLTLTLTDTTTNAVFKTSQAINIPTTVGANTAYVGFTGGTGGLTATQYILNWTYLVN